jgi:hypothetical protein
MNKLLVLLNRPEDINGHVAELKEIAITHKIKKVYLARLSCSFGPRARCIITHSKLEAAARISDAAAGEYLEKIAEDFRSDKMEAESIPVGIQFGEIERFVKENGVGIIATSDGRSGLCHWLVTGLPSSHVLFLYEHVFWLAQPAHQASHIPSQGRKRAQRKKTVYTPRQRPSFY